MNYIYTAPVSEFLGLGKPDHYSKDWLNYLEMGLNEEHIPQLMQMVADDELHQASSESLELWAPVHAWRTLGQLKAEESITILLDAMEEDDDWARGEIPTVLSMIGEGSIPALSEFISDSSKDQFARSNAAEALEKIAELFPHRFEECVSIVGDQFNRYHENSRELNALLIWSLQNFGAVHNYLGSIEKSFEANLVDEAIIGDWEDVQIELGLLEERITPKKNYQFEKYPQLQELIEGFEKPSSLPSSSPANQLKKIGRNDPCPCGSGKKYKKCCLKNEQ